MRRQCGLRARACAPPEATGDTLEQGERQLHPPDRTRRGAHSNQASRQRKGRRMDPPRRQEIRLGDHLVYPRNLASFHHSLSLFCQTIKAGSFGGFELAVEVFDSSFLEILSKIDSFYVLWCAQDQPDILG